MSTRTDFAHLYVGGAPTPPPTCVPFDAHAHEHAHAAAAAASVAAHVEAYASALANGADAAAAWNAAAAVGATAYATAYAAAHVGDYAAAVCAPPRRSKHGACTPPPCVGATHTPPPPAAAMGVRLRRATTPPADERFCTPAPRGWCGHAPPPPRRPAPPPPRPRTVRDAAPRRRRRTVRIAGRGTLRTPDAEDRTSATPAPRPSRRPLAIDWLAPRGERCPTCRHPAPPTGHQCTLDSYHRALALCARWRIEEDYASEWVASHSAPRWPTVRGFRKFALRRTVGGACYHGDAPWGISREAHAPDAPDAPDAAHPTDAARRARATWETLAAIARAASPAHGVAILTGLVAGDDWTAITRDAACSRRTIGAVIDALRERAPHALA